ncbi:MAG: response regulator transcription factor, partial [Thermomicrobiales bacterium]|nr:response regulator transcription factor [Thermomicrobiales bacterium]
NVYATDLGEEGIDLAKLYDYDLILLDLHLPDMNGHEVLRQLRLARVDTPILILSGADDPDNKIKGFGFGADDYLTKPFGMGELLARLRVVLRRQRGAQAASLRAGDVLIDLEHRRVERAGEEVRLTPTELSLLLVLARDAGKVLTHRQILQRVWGEYAAENSAQLRVYINYLRRKLERDPAHPVLIVTEPGVGYRLKTDTEGPGSR